jgi:DNA-directed RNA polymerase subunit H (RpoH/RPB5)
MDDISFIHNAWNTCLELAKDRNYVVDENYYKLNETEFKYLYNENKLDIVCSKENNNIEKKKLYIKFLLYHKIKPSYIKEVINEIKEQIDMKDLELILVLKIKPNNTILKLQRDINLGLFQIMWCKKLQFNPIKHELVPKHTKISETEADKLLINYNLKNKFQLPIILREDVISQYYNYQQGDIIKITNTATSLNKEYIFYRCVK